MPDVIRCRHLFGGDDRMEERRVDGCKHRNALRARQQRGRPRQRLEAGLLIVGQPARSAPPPERQKKLEADLIGHPCQTLVVVPRAAPALGHERCIFPRIEVAPEDPELEFVGASHRQPGGHRRAMTEQHAASSLFRPKDFAS